MKPTSLLGVVPRVGRVLTAARTAALCSSSREPPTPMMPPARGGEPQGLGAVNNADEIPTLKLYRDCMRLTYHIAAHSTKGEAMRTMIRGQFRAQMGATEPEEIARLKMLAVVGLQNYVIHEQTGKALDKRKRSKPPKK